MPRKHTDITGGKYGMLTPIKYIGGGKWLCQCDCGNQSIHYAHHLKNGTIKSCGCMHYIRTEARKTSGLSRESYKRLNHIWQGMKKRCSDPCANGYKLYGGRGITVCKEWEDFSEFVKWSVSHGYADDLTIDRIDNDGDYCPENCRWATAIQQANNRYTNKYIEFDGKRLTYSQWARKTGLHKNTIRMRILKGWSVEDCLTTPAWKNPKSE